MAEESNDCSLCLEPLDKCSVVHLNCCSGQRIHIECYAKSLPKCPFCRAQQPEILPKIVVITDWPKVRRFIGVSFLLATCTTIFIIINTSQRDC
jgi:hypothetical protein